MPQSILNFVYRFNARTHMLFAMVLGLIARLSCAFFTYGPQALDDYKHGMIPAYEKLYKLSSTLPDYRNPLLHEILAFFAGIGHAFGATSALSETRFMMMGLALISLLGIWGVYRTAYAHQKHEATVIAVYLMSLQGLMPFISTRAFGEVVAMSLLIFGIGIIEKEKFKLRSHSILYVWGWFFIGLSCLFRFHIGLIALTLFIYYIFKREKKIWVSALIAALFTLSFQYWIDAAHGQPFLHSFVAYLKINQGGAAGYGVSPWYNTWLLVLGFTLFPFSLVFIKKIPDLLYEHFPIVLSVFVFVLAHSIVPHKEERFLYPILGLLWVMLGYVWGHSVKSWTARSFYFPIFVVLNTLLLIVTTSFNTQEGEVDPLFTLEKRGDTFALLNDDSLISQSRITEYFLRRNSLIIPFSVDAVESWASTQTVHSQKVDTIGYVTSDFNHKEKMTQVLTRLKTIARCSEIIESGSKIDSLLYKLNPKHNQRRRPTWFFFCKQG